MMRGVQAITAWILIHGRRLRPESGRPYGRGGNAPIGARAPWRCLCRRSGRGSRRVGARGATQTERLRCGWSCDVSQCVRVPRRQGCADVGRHPSVARFGAWRAPDPRRGPMSPGSRPRGAKNRGLRRIDRQRVRRQRQLQPAGTDALGGRPGRQQRSRSV